MGRPVADATWDEATSAACAAVSTAFSAALAASAAAFVAADMAELAILEMLKPNGILTAYFLRRVSQIKTLDLTQRAADFEALFLLKFEKLISFASQRLFSP